jgi:hypothetical protein
LRRARRGKPDTDPGGLDWVEIEEIAWQVGIGRGFWSLTLWELECAIRGYARRAENTRRLLAWHACHVMAPHLRKRDRPTPEKLLGNRKSAESKRRKRKRKKKRKDKGLRDGD